MAAITVYTAPECCLCDDAKAILEPLGLELGVEVEYVDITTDPALERDYREQIPVGFLGERKIFKYHVDEGVLRRALAR